MGSAGVGFSAVGGCEGFPESSRAHLALRLSGGRTCRLSVLARGTLDVGSALVQRCDGFEEPGCTRLALGLGGARPTCLGVLARRALRVGAAGVALSAARHFGFEESTRAHLALGLIGGGCCLDVFAWWALNFATGDTCVGLGAVLRCN